MTPKKEKPPAQVAGVVGIDAHKGMGSEPSQPPPQSGINWHRLVNLPAFEMFIHEQSGFSDKQTQLQWVGNRRDALGDDALFKLYADWHKAKGYWVNETPMGELR